MTTKNSDNLLFLIVLFNKGPLGVKCLGQTKKRTKRNWYYHSFQINLTLSRRVTRLAGQSKDNQVSLEREGIITIRSIFLKVN